ncbi:MAG: UDP-N-acetylmuramoyl-L-alanine--D-glutamate ligase [Chloroflexota bacterium]
MTVRTDELAGRRVTVLGFGRREGVSLVRFLVAQGAEVLVSDQQPAEKLDESLAAVAGLPVEFNLGGHDADRLLDWSETICVSPVIPRTTPLLLAAQRRGITLSSEVELFFERSPASIIGVTGSAGKTTTTTLIGSMLEQSGRPVVVGGNIGTPLLGTLPRLTPEHTVVMELSSFQLQPMQRSPHGAVVTNVTPNHLDRHAGMDEYIEAKRQIVRHQVAGDWAVLNSADPTVAAFAGATPAPIAWFGSTAVGRNGDAAFVENGELALRRDGCTRSIAPLAALRLRGPHNLENAQAAVLTASLAGAGDTAISAVLASFGGVEHRQQCVGEIGGARFYDDSIASTPERLLAALRSFEEPLVVIVGGRDKHLPWSEAAEALCRQCHTLILTGEARHLIREAVGRAAERGEGRPRLVDAPQFDIAVEAALSVARAGDAVLLSPGCTSFDQFRDFEERGQRFATLVTSARGFTPC